MQLFPQVQWLQMGYNAGFARANNAGIRLSKGNTVLLLNPDILMNDSSVSICYDRFSTSAYVACGVQLLNRDGSPQISGNYFIKGGINHFLPLPFWGRVFKGLGTALKVKKTNIPEATDEVMVDWVNGAFLMVKKDAVEKAGLLDEDFFLYAEEIEWCARLRKTGGIYIYGDLHVIHLQGEVSNETFASAGKGYYNLFDKKGRQILISNFVRIRKQFGAIWFIIHLLVYLVEIPFFFLLVVLQYLFSKSPQYSLQQFKGYCRNMAFLLSRSGTMLQNKSYFYKVL